ncbi:MAG: ROK family protein [Chloroflexi bacterium]|nr:MAG: ROK family protein [Chloroflexota bacterium]
MNYVGIDLGGTRLRVAIAGAGGPIQHVVRHPTEADRGPEHVINRIVKTIEEALRHERIKPAEVASMAIGMPGPANGKTGVVLSPPNLPGWRDVPIASILTERTAIPTNLENDANLAAFGEARAGAGKGARNLAYVTVSTGIGAGLVLDGRLYSGASGVAGEVGHIVIEPGGPLCNCGNRGCLEAIASGTAIARAAREALETRARTQLRRHRESDGPTAAEVVRAARGGDALSRRLLDRAGTALGIGMGTLVNLLNPELLILGGSVMKAGGLINRPMQTSLKVSSWESARRGLRIVAPRLGQNAGLVGAVEWARLQATSAARVQATR